MNNSKIARIAVKLAGVSPVLTLVIGMPGSGKSTFANTISDASHYEADMFFVNDNGEYIFDGSKLKQAHEWCKRMTERDLSNGRNVVVSNTGLTLWEREQYYFIAERYGAKIRVKIMTGDYGNIHNVPKESLDKMRGKYQPLSKIEIEKYNIEVMK